MDQEQTEKFVWLWNEKNGFDQGLVDQPNMRYVAPDKVTWNEYDAPVVSLSQFKELTSKVEEKSNGLHAKE